MSKRDELLAIHNFSKLKSLDNNAKIKYLDKIVWRIFFDSAWTRKLVKIP